MRRHFVTIIGLFFILLAQSLRAASSCPLDSVLTFNIDSLLTEVTIYDYVVDTARTTVWTVDPQTGTRTGKSREESFSSALKELTATYVWENNTWKGTNKVVKAYQKFAGVKKQISETTFIWLNGAWVADKGFKNDYDDAARETEHFEYHRNTTTNKLEPTSGYRYEWIDDTQKSLEEIYTTYTNGAWSAGTKQEWAFDEAGRQILSTFYGTITNGNWVGTSKEEWGYTDSVLTMTAQYVWANDDWEGTLKEVWAYDTIGRTTLHEQYGWYNSDWSMTLREIADFDEAGNQILIENYTGANGVTTGTQKEEYTFDENGNKTSAITYKWSKGAWVGSTHEITEYNGPKGEKSYYEKQVWRSGAWGDSIQETWVFDGPDGKQTLHEKYTWKDGAMVKYLEYTTEYEGTQVKRYENYLLENGVWTGKKKEIFGYTSGKKTSHLVYAWEEGAWVNSNQEIWTFNGPSSKQTLYEKHEWENGAWVKTVRDTIGYTGNYITLEESYERQAGVWTGTTKKEHTYNGSKKIQSIVYSWDNGAWVADTKDEWTPSSSKPTLHEQYTWDGDWVITLQENTTYSGSNKTLVENYKWIEGVKTGTAKEVWTYTSGKQTLHETYEWYNGDWSMTLREIADFDAAGNQTLIENYTGANGVTTGTKKEEYTYTDGQKTQVITYQWYNNTIWIYQFKEAWVFESGHQTLHEKQGWNGLNWVDMQREIAAFDEVGNQTLVENYVLTTDGWMGIEKEEYTFEGDKKMTTIIYLWKVDRWENYVKNVEGYQIDNTHVSIAYHVWDGNAWKGIGTRTFTTYNDNNKITELITQNWPNGASDWTDSIRTRNSYNEEGTNILTHNSKWDGTKWVMTSMTRNDIIKDDEGRTLLNASWSCAADSVWKGIKKDSAVYSATGNSLFKAQYTSWANNDWVISYLIERNYDDADRLILEQKYDWKNGHLEGNYKNEYEFDSKGRTTMTATYLGWNTNSNNWIGNTKYRDFFAADGSKEKRISYTWNNDAWAEDYIYTYTYDDTGREILQIVQRYSNGVLGYTNKYVKEYQGTKLVKENSYRWRSNDWQFYTQKESYYDNDAQAKLRHEIEGSWNTRGVLKSYEEKYYAYSCDTRYYTIRFVNDDGSLLLFQKVEEGQLPEYTGIEPSKQADAQYTYTFAGWDKIIVVATTDATYTATYTTTTNTYTITWLNDDNSQIDQTTVAYNQTPTHLDPYKPEDAQNIYTFAGWDPIIVPVTGNATYKATYSITKKNFTITWLNDDSSLIDQTQVKAGTTPTHIDPSKQADAQYTYSFSGWTPTIVEATADATYTATYTATTKSYEITWLNDNGTLIDKTIVEYGKTPTHEEAEKEATAEYSYSFANWTPTIIPVIGEATYTAVFTPVKNSYIITWLDDDNSLLGTTTVEYGIIPTYGDPTKQTTAEYTYSFAGWDVTPIAVTGPATYKATYIATKNSYTITWLDDDDSSLGTTTVEYGIVPTHADPTKAATAEWTYTFAGWDVTPIAVTGPATYKATYTATKNSYTITWLDDDDSLLGTTTVEYGEIPTHDDPEKASTAEYTYTFAGWSPAVAAVTGNATYTATYAATKNSYTITWLDDEGTEIDHTTVEFGLTPAHANIEKESTDEYTYSFAGWSPAIVPVTGDATYQATFSASKRSYLITFYYENGTTILDQVIVEYGATPATSLIPSSPSDAHYSYTFAGWAPEVVPVTGEASYVATYTAIPNKYTITFKNYNGRVLERTKVEYGATPEYEGETPFRPATASCVYEFAGWSPEIAEVIGDATYTAVFEEIINTYTIIFYDEDGITELDRTIVEHGQKPTTEVVPTKPEDEEFTYTFAGWNPKVVKATADASYVATYTATPKTTPEGVSNVDAASEQVTKVIIDGQIFILRGAHIYSIDGILVR